MEVIGTNRWEFDSPKEFIIAKALEFTEEVRNKGIAELTHAWIAPEERLLWCTWKTENFAELESAFEELNERTGLISDLTIVEDFAPVGV